MAVRWFDFIGEMQLVGIDGHSIERSKVRCLLIGGDLEKVAGMLKLVGLSAVWLIIASGALLFDDKFTVCR